MNLRKNLSRVAGASATFATAALAVSPVVASGIYDDYYYTTTADTAAAGLFGLGTFAYVCCICILPLVVGGVLAYIVYKDAKKNQVENAALWAVLTFFFSLIGLLVYYLAIRPEAIKKLGSTGTSTSEPSGPQAS